MKIINFLHILLYTISLVLFRLNFDKLYQMSKYNQSARVSRRLQLAKQQKQISYTFSKTIRFNCLKKIKTAKNKESELFEEEEQSENQKLKREIKIVLDRCFVQEEFSQSRQPYIPRQEQSTHERCKIVPQIEKLSLIKSARSTASSGRRINTERSFDQKDSDAIRQIKSYSSTPHIVDFSQLKAPASRIKAFLSKSPSNNNQSKASAVSSAPQKPLSSSPNVIISAVYSRKN